MKRSEINRVIRETKAFLEEHRFPLPPFAHWSPEDWRAKGPEADEIRRNMLGWDLTDFGFGDFERLEQVTLSTSALDGTFQDAWVNDLFPGRTLETGTTCEMYRDGTAIVLNEVLFGTKGQTINNVAPGVFFYYTKFIAPPADFTVDLRQKNDSAFVNFLLQNAQQVRLFNGDCSTPAATFTLTFDSGQVQLDISGAVPGQEFILSAKYDTSNVVGQTAPKQPVRYDFHTDVNGVLVDQDLDGLILRKK